MSNGIDLFSPCCHNSLAKNKEYDNYKDMPVFTCVKCQKSWVIERVIRSNDKKRK